MAISVIVFLLFTPILKILRADGDLSVYFTEYYRIMLFTYPLMVIGTILGMFIRVDGKPQICMLVSIAGCILNGVLDFFFVDIMRFGIQGSAVASLIVQLLTVLVQMFYFISRKTGIGFRKFSFDREIKTGDRLCFCDMAIYSMVKNNTFNGMPLPDIAVMDENNDCKVIRRFEYEDFKCRLS